MKLLFDENLSRRLVPLLANDYPDSAHVVACGLGTAPALQALVDDPTKSLLVLHATAP